MTCIGSKCADPVHHTLQKPYFSQRHLQHEWNKTQQMEKDRQMEEQRSSDTVGQCDRQHSQHIPSLTAVKMLINFTAKGSFKEAAKENLLEKSEVR